jgi:hypothetical protein
MQRRVKSGLVIDMSELYNNVRSLNIFDDFNIWYFFVYVPEHINNKSEK